MGKKFKLSDEAVANRYRRRSVKLQEAAEAVIVLLNEVWKCNRAGKSVKKRTLLGAIPGQVQENRKLNNGVQVPTVNNREVQVAGFTFCNNNWAAIRTECEKYGYFIVWNMPGEPPGLRLGTAEERQHIQGYTIAATEGFVRTHNNTARRLRRFGIDETVDLTLNEELNHDKE